MQICNICGAEEDGGNISVEYDRKRGMAVSNKDLHFTKCCQHAIARGKIGCLNRDDKVLDLPYLHVRAIT